MNPLAFIFRALAFVAAIATVALAAEKPRPHVFMVGDSTMANKTPAAFPEWGWGMALGKFFVDPAMIQNHAKNGRSSKSFIDEGLWEKVLGELKAGDFVIIQF